MNKDAITRSLELVGDRGVDPAPLVYKRLFAANPEMEALFIRDTTGAVRGNMLALVFDLIMDYVDAGAYGANMIRAEVVNHDQIGVPSNVFATFFATVRDALREVLGADWDGEIDAAWRDMLAEFDRLTAVASA